VVGVVAFSATGTEIGISAYCFMDVCRVKERDLPLLCDGQIASVKVGDRSVLAEVTCHSATATNFDVGEACVFELAAHGGAGVLRDVRRIHEDAEALFAVFERTGIGCCEQDASVETQDAKDLAKGWENGCSGDVFDDLACNYGVEGARGGVDAVGEAAEGRFIDGGIDEGEAFRDDVEPNDVYIGHEGFDESATASGVATDVEDVVGDLGEMLRELGITFQSEGVDLAVRLVLIEADEIFFGRGHDNSH
jgi:hypothetical protein